MPEQTVLTRPMPNAGPVTWPGACWVGQIQTAALPHTGQVMLNSWEGETTARLLVRDAGRVRGFVTVPVADGQVDAAQLTAQAARLGPGDPVSAGGQQPMVSVVLCTKDRPQLLAAAMASVLALDYPSWEVVVVDNAPSDDATERYLAELDHPRVRRVLEPVPGLARARNTGIQAAQGEIIAFTDDDVLVDPFWLTRLVAAFDLAPAVGCVSGLVPSGELRTPTQAFFDQRVTWSDAVSRKIFCLADPPAGMPLFPFQVGEYGTGANFALRRIAAYQLGGFDEALGVGTPTGGGEDLDMFVRVLLAGWALVVEPSALVWHRHRDDSEALVQQARGYGRGLGAWLTKVVTTPSTAALAAQRAVVGLRRLAAVRRGSVSSRRVDLAHGLPPAYVAELGRLEVQAVFQGPRAYWRSRLAGNRKRPLASRASR